MSGKITVFNYVFAKIKNIGMCSVRKLIGIRRFKRKRYNGKKVLSIHDANQQILEMIQKGEPFLVARFGDAELRTLVYGIENGLKLRKGFPQYIKTAMSNNAGFFPADDDNLLKFSRVLFDSSKCVDFFGVWNNLLEDYVIKKSSPNAFYTDLESLEPYRTNNPWSQGLHGKKVLIVHPFSESIKTQYQRRKLIFEDPNVLPDFTLITYKTVQTNAGGVCDFSSWFEALQHMTQEISKIDFDIAIVGCGSYGLPLASNIKRMGKQVIHLAGATQILFGIRGARWDVRPEMQYLFNEYWIRPSEDEKPKNASSVEGGCYW